MDNIGRIKDIKPPLGFGPDYALIILALALCVLALVFFIYWRKKRRKKRIVPPKPPEPAHQIAYQKLNNLKAKGLIESGRVKQYYFELSDIIRHYIEMRFNIKAPEMTREEFFYFLTHSPRLQEVNKNLLRDFLNRCDMVKFAKYGPSAEEINNSFESAVKFVDETKQGPASPGRNG